MKDTTRTFIIVATVITVLSLMKMGNANANPNALYLSCEGTATETLANHKKDAEGQYSGKKTSYRVQATYKILANYAERTMTDENNAYWRDSATKHQVNITDHEIRLTSNIRLNQINRFHGGWIIDEHLAGRRLQVTGTCRKAERAF